MQIKKNYRNDIIKSRQTPLLIELSKKDIDALHKDDGLNYALLVAKKIYNKPLEDKKSTNIIFIDSDKINDTTSIYLFDRLLDEVSDQLKNIKNLNTIKETIGAGISIATSGVIGDTFGGFINQGVDLISDSIGDNISDILVDNVIDTINLSGDFEDKIIDIITTKGIDELDTISKQKLFLSKAAKDKLEELSLNLKDDLTPAESFRFILKLMLTISIKMPSCIFIKNPHKLDKNSLAILSLLFSYSKDMKDNNIHTGLSIIYAYCDEDYQPYKEVGDRYKEIKQILDEQRLFTQRYAMLERPTSDIPHIAVKSSMFVGRTQEIENLKQRYQYSKEDTKIITFEVISGEPGIGKTTLIKKHQTNLKKDEQNGEKIIQLKLLNQVGHSSSNTGLGSLIDSIIQEVTRLESIKTFKENIKDKAVGFVASKTLDLVKGALGVDKLINVGTALKDRIDLDEQIMQTKEHTFGNIDNKSQDKKEQQYQNLNTAIYSLIELSDDTKPIVLFIDDIQWIDEDSAEYILKYFVSKFNIHILSTLRPMDATTVLKQSQENETLNENKISLLQMILENKSILNIELNKVNLSGLDCQTLESLISQVIQGDKTYQEILAITIIKELSNKTNTKYVNTLFAVETINMLCDEKLYRSQDKDTIEKLILTDNTIRFNDNLKDFQDALNTTFDILKAKYEKSFTHSSQDIEGKFNLMAYAVLEERLNILRIYFNEYGDTAVNTLLFSSLLGTPFNSIIVSNILGAISTTDNKKLQPLKEYITKSSSNTELTAEHYEIIEEVYEILSRYMSFDNSYEYRHGLLNIFLDKQLEYLLDEVLGKENIEAKDLLYNLVFEKLFIYNMNFEFQKNNKQNLNYNQYSEMIIFHKTELNIFKKGCSHNSNRWLGSYRRALSDLAKAYLMQNDIKESLKLQKEAVEIITTLYTKNQKENAEDYITSIYELSYIYNIMGNNKEALTLNLKLLSIIKNIYGEKNEKYFECIQKIAFYYNENNKNIEAIKILNESIIIIKELYKKDKIKWKIPYCKALLGLGDTHVNNRYYVAIEYYIESLNILEDNGDSEYPYQLIYINNLNNLIYAYGIGKIWDDAIKTHNKILVKLEDLYKKDESLWLNEYLLALDYSVHIYTYGTDKIAKFQQQSLELTKEYYEQNKEIWEKDYCRRINNLSNTITERMKTQYFAEILNEHNKTEIRNNILIQLEAIDISKELYIENPEVFNSLHISCLDNLIKMYYYLDEYSKSIILSKEIINILSIEYSKNSHKWKKYYISAYNNLIDVLEKNGQFKDANDAEEKKNNI